MKLKTKKFPSLKEKKRAWQAYIKARDRALSTYQKTQAEAWKTYYETISGT